MTHAPRRRSRHQPEQRVWRRARKCDERGSSLVEFALVVPLLSMFLFAIIDFGTVYSNQISVRQGVREGARSGSVGAYGTSTACLNPFTAGLTPSADMQKLMCLVKNRVGITPTSSVYVKIDFDTSYALNSGLMVCVLAPAKSITGVTSQLLASTYIQTKVEMSIEQATGSETGGEEAPPSGASWSWCIPSGATP